VITLQVLTEGQRGIRGIARGFVEKRGVTDGTNAGAVTQGFNLRGEGGATSPVHVAYEAQFYEIVGAQGAAELCEKSGRETLFSDSNGRFEFLAEAA
jgi:hypothetical protein